MPAKKNSSPKSSGPKKPVKVAKKPATAVKAKSVSKSKPAKNAANGKKPATLVKKKSPKPAASKKAKAIPAKAVKPAKAAKTAKPAKAVKAPKAAEVKKAAKVEPAPAPAPVATPGSPGRPRKNAAATPRLGPMISKPLHFAPLKPTPRHKPEEVGATIEVAKGPVKWTPFLKKQKQRLIDLRDTLLNLIEGVSKESLRQRAEGGEASAFGMHQADAGSDAYDRDFALSLLSQEQDALNEINEALTRMTNGTYGICEMSGKKIPEIRLEALPFTRFTVECQERIERQQMGGRGRLPVRSLFGLDEAADETGEDAEEEETTSTSRSGNSESLDFAKE